MGGELWEMKLNSLKIYKEVKPIRLRRRSKKRLVEIFKKGENLMSPVIDTEVREGADDIAEGVLYEIVNAESITTDVQSLSGIRVTLVDQKGGEGNVMLWQRKVTGTGSKMGVFITTLGNNTDKWLGKWIVFKIWQDRKREVEVVPAPAPKATKAKNAPAT